MPRTRAARTGSLEALLLGRRASSSSTVERGRDVMGRSPQGRRGSAWRPAGSVPKQDGDVVLEVAGEEQDNDSVAGSQVRASNKGESG